MACHSASFSSEQKSVFSSHFHQDLAVQKGLKAKYFSGSKECHALLNALFRSLKANAPFAFINRSSSGGTGFTFLGQVPSNALSEEVPNQRIGLVIKWQQEGQCNVERIGALFYQTLGFPAPATYRIDPKLANQLGPFGEKKCPAMGDTYKSLTLIGMPLLDANNFKEASKSKLKLLSREDQQTMLQKFGEIALLDLILGNDDRFISFTDDVENPFKVTSSFNSGNVMMEFEEFEGKVQKLVDVYPIDNCTLDLADKKTYVSGCEEDLCLGFFDGDLSTSPPDSPSSAGVTPQSISPPVAPVDPEIQFQEKIIRLNKVCLRLISDLDCVAKHVQNNIVKDLSERTTDLGEYQEFIDMIPDHLSIGMRQALEKIRKFDCGSFVQQFEAEGLDPFSRRALDLIKLNVASVQ